MNTPNELLDVVYQDDCLVVVNKPSGLLAVPGRGPEHQDCVVNRLKRLYPFCIEQPAVHRLDMDTSGLMILALTATAHRLLSKAFENRLVDKSYTALLDGVIQEDQGIIELRSRLDIDNRPRQIVDPVQGKIGITVWQKTAIEGHYTRVLFHPTTGRTHQLRLHAAHPEGLGTPIVGDRLYGNGTEPGQLKLHASRLTFVHPATQLVHTLCCEPPF